MTDQALIALAEKHGKPILGGSIYGFALDGLKAFAAALAREQEAQPALDSDGEPMKLCTVCGSPVRYGSRHSQCGAAIRAAQPAAQEPNYRALYEQVCETAHHRLKELARVDAQLAALNALEPVATLHDDGYWTWNNKGADRTLRDASTVAGWRMPVYAAQPAAQEPSIDTITPPVTCEWTNCLHRTGPEECEQCPTRRPAAQEPKP
jgi:hypothetical protein